MHATHHMVSHGVLFFGNAEKTRRYKWHCIGVLVWRLQRIHPVKCVANQHHSKLCFESMASHVQAAVDLLIGHLQCRA